MNIQEIFNRVIDQGYYNTLTPSSAMCVSLRYARWTRVISEDEYLFALEQIDEYLEPSNCTYLFRALEEAGLPHTIEARTAIYQDWANRPSLGI